MEFHPLEAFNLVSLGSREEAKKYFKIIISGTFSNITEILRQ